jgi:uncharacterized membrane protein YbaN (DUF454 family)
MTTDAFTRASPHFRAAMAKANRQHPVLQIGERSRGLPWQTLTLIAIGIVCGVALILVPAAIQAARHG